MTRNIRISYTRIPYGFSRARTEVYEGVVFRNGKVAYIGEDNAIHCYDDRNEMLSALKKTGIVNIREKEANDE